MATSVADWFRGSARSEGALQKARAIAKEISILMVRMAESKTREELVMKTYFMRHSVLHPMLGLAISVMGTTILVTSVSADDGTVSSKTIFQPFKNHDIIQT